MKIITETASNVTKSPDQPLSSLQFAFHIYVILGHFWTVNINVVYVLPIVHSSIYMIIIVDYEVDLESVTQVDNQGLNQAFSNRR